MTEQYFQPPLPIELPLGEIALRADRPHRPAFGVTDEEVAAIVPALTEGIVAMRHMFGVADAGNASSDEALIEAQGEDDNTEATDEDTTPVEATHTASAGRRATRKSRNVYSAHVMRIIRTGSQYIATFADEQAGIAAAREIFIPEADAPLGNIFAERIVPSAASIRRVRTAASQLGENIAAIDGTDDRQVAKRYTLLKALGQYNKRAATDDDESDLSLAVGMEFCLSALCAIDGSDINKKLTSELHDGAYDLLIAQDVLRYIGSGQAASTNYAKIEQLVSFMKSYLGNTADHATVQARMLETFEDWPQPQRAVIIESRQRLLSHLENKTGLVTRSLRKDGFIGVDDPKEAFEKSFDLLGDEMLRRAIVTPQNRAQIMLLRAEKRGRITPRRQRRRDLVIDEEVIASPEEQREPLKVHTYNLNDFSIVENVDDLIEEYVKNTSQGNPNLRQDLINMINFMARTDLPPAYRRGVKAIQESKVKFGTPDDPDKLWDYFEFKPTEAAGLPTKTSNAKSLRIYFIKPGNDTLGIIGIKARSEQDNFLRSIRVKTKRRT